MQYFLGAAVSKKIYLHRGQEDRSQLELPNEVRVTVVLSWQHM